MPVSSSLSTIPLGLTGTLRRGELVEVMSFSAFLKSCVQCPLSAARIDFILLISSVILYWSRHQCYNYCNDIVSRWSRYLFSLLCES